MNDTIYNRIEEQFKSRASSNPSEYGKPGSKKYLNRQAEFFTGAMAAMVAISELSIITPTGKKTEEDIKASHGKALPPKWVFSIMRGDDIVKVSNDLKQKA